MSEKNDCCPEVILAVHFHGVERCEFVRPSRSRIMKNMTVLWAGGLLGVSIAMMAAATASAQVLYAPPIVGVYVRPGYAAYPYGYPYNPRRAYRQAVRFGLAPVVPPPVLRGPTDYFGRPFYGPPYYAYPTPPPAYPGYGGFSGSAPNAYRSMVPPPSPISPDLPPNAQPTPSPEEVPTPSAPAEPIPPPPSDPGLK
jgi:hypothetical protein